MEPGLLRDLTLGNSSSVSHGVSYVTINSVCSLAGVSVTPNLNALELLWTFTPVHYGG